MYAQSAYHANPAARLIARLRHPCAIALMIGLLPCADAAIALPTVTGEVSGVFSSTEVPGATVQWTMTSESGENDSLVVRIRANGRGADLDLEISIPQKNHASGMTWRLHRAILDLGVWWSAAKSQLPAGAREASVAGRLELQGSGGLRDGKIGGVARASVSGGRFELPWLTLDGIEVSLQMDDLAGWRSAAEQTLSITGGSYDTLPLGRGRVVFAIDNDQVRVTSSALEIFGGRLLLGAFQLSLPEADFAVHARVEGVKLAQLAELLPSVVAEANGELDGDVMLYRRDERIEIGTGAVSLRPGETGALQLAPNPGLLSERLPKNNRLTAIYPALARLETGKTTLRTDRLYVRFAPDGDEEGRTVVMHIEGEPIDPELKIPLVLDLNVRGPLDWLVRFGSNTKLRFGTGR